MDILEIMKNRHAVRKYNNKQIEEEKVEILNSYIDELNAESGLNFKLVLNDKDAFLKGKKSYGQFENVNNYILLKGCKTSFFQEKCGFFGEKLVLKCAELGLSSCWVVLTFNKDWCKQKLEEGEKLCAVVSVGYADNIGTPHKSKELQKLTNVKPMPDWFKRGITASMLAPTALNQQKFFVTLDDNNPIIKIKDFGFYTKIDLGIVKCHFELASGKKVNRNY